MLPLYCTCRSRAQAGPKPNIIRLVVAAILLGARVPIIHRRDFRASLVDGRRWEIRDAIFVSTAQTAGMLLDTCI